MKKVIAWIIIGIGIVVGIVFQSLVIYGAFTGKGIAAIFLFLEFFCAVIWAVEIINKKK